MIRFKIPYPKDKKKRAKFTKQYGLNAIYSGKFWQARNSDKTYWHYFVLAQLQEQKIPQKVFETPVCITFYWHDGLDLDNHAYMVKMIIDSIKGYLLINDDKRYITKIIYKFQAEDCITVEVENEQ